MDANSDDNAEIRRLFVEYIPEVASGVVQIKSVARERGYRAIVAVHSTDPKVCPVGSCVGLRGYRVKTITAQLSGDKVDIIRWSESPETLIRNAISPAIADHIVFDAAAHSATIHARPEYRSVILGQDGSRVQLISKLAGWNIRVADM